MRHYAPIIYIIGVILSFIGFIMYNFGVSNDRSLVTAALTIGVGMAFLLASYL